MHKIYILLIAAVSVAFSQPAIAIRDLKGVGVSSQEAAIVSSKLQTEFVHSKRFEVLERAEMAEITKEMAFSASGLCDDDNCLVELGKMLSVEKLIVGSIGRLEGSYTLTMRLLDVESGTIENSYASPRVSSMGAVYDSLIPQSVQFFIRKFDFKKHELKVAGKVGGITPKITLNQPNVVIASGGLWLSPRVIMEAVENQSPPKRLTWKLGDGPERVIKHPTFATDKEISQLKKIKVRRVGFLEGFPARNGYIPENCFYLGVPREKKAYPLILSLECESGAVVSDTSYIIPRDITRNEIKVTALKDLLEVNEHSHLSSVAGSDPVGEEYLNLWVGAHAVQVAEFDYVMSTVEGYRSPWKVLSPLNSGELSDEAKRVETVRINNDAKVKEYGISWYNAVLYCNAKSKKFGLDTLYTYTKVKGRLGSPTCKLVDVKLRQGNGYRLLSVAEAKKIFRCGTELYDNNLGLNIKGYEWASEKGKVYSPVGDKKKFSPHTYSLQGKSNSKRGIVPAFRVVRAVTAQ